MLKSLAGIIQKISEELNDEELEKAIKRIPQLQQRQYDTNTQLKYLAMAAVRLGLYDADDFLKKFINRKAFLPPHGYETLMKIRRPELKRDPKQEKPEKINPGEIVEVYNDGKWTKIKWPQN